ncbi:MAG: GTPase Era [Salibacteraceae bacterium]
MSDSKTHKSGFVNIVGNPNVGKSTLMNQLVGEKLSIITSKAQTTRHRIQGIVSGEDFQIVYSDTPGILNPAYKMHEGMMSFVHESLKDADVLLLVFEIGENKIKDESIFEKLKNLNIPIIIALNKIDLSTQEEVAEKVEFWQEIFPTASILPISALHKANIDMIFSTIVDKLPESPAYFPKDEMTDKPIRFFLSEIIREKIFVHYKKEIPYSCEVEITEYKTAEDITRVRAEIYVERDSQKGILIGHKGQGLKRVGSEARRDMEKFLDKKIFLAIYVKVNKDWRNKPTQLKRFGYLN